MGKDEAPLASAGESCTQAGQASSRCPSCGLLIAAPAVLCPHCGAPPARPPLRERRLVPRAGDTVGGFHLEELLGQGGMGVVYRARDLRLDRPVALKFLDLDALAGEPLLVVAELKQRFHREARLAARISHPHVVQIFQAGLAAETPYFVMEYVAGEALDRLVRQGQPWPARRVAALGRQVAAALQHAWQRHRIIHRDLKPANILLLEDDFVKLLDLGIAKTLAPDGPEAHITNGQFQIGSPLYMAPEQHTGAPGLDQRVDIFALGLILWRLLTGSSPFAGGDVQELYRAKLRGPARPLAELAPAAPPALAELLLRMLAPDPARRVAAYEEIAAVLDAVASAPGGEVPSSARGPVPAAAEPGLQTTLTGPAAQAAAWGYDLGECLGRGSLGSVYRARRRADGREVALKFLSPAAGDPQFPERLRHAAERLRELRHPGILELLDWHEAGGLAALVSPLLLGPEGRPVNLRDYAASLGGEGRLDQGDLRRLLLRVLDALAGGHRAGVVHGNLKPENVLLEYVGRAGDCWRVHLHISDFGLVRAMGEADFAASVSRSVAGASEGAAAALLASLDYLSPEQRRGEPLQPAADVYAAGMILLRLLTGVAELQVGRRPSQLRPGIHPAWDDIILPALRERPETRPDTAALIRALEALPLA